MLMKAQLLRLGRTGTILVTAAVATATVGSCGAVDAGHKAAEYCALMPDAVGLYQGNPVTHMGLPIGEVTNITAQSRSVRVEFTVTDVRVLPADVKAIIRSTSVLADRSLELVGNVGNNGNPRLKAGSCIPLSQSFTPKSLSESIGAANTLVNAISPADSTNVGDVVHGLDAAIHSKGPDVNRLITTASALLHSPDQTISAIGSVVENIAQLTALIRELRDPIKQVMLDIQTAMPSIVRATGGGSAVLGGTLILVKAISDIEQNLGDTIQFTLDETSVGLRKASAHAPALSDLLNPVPSLINIAANHVNNRRLDVIRYRPPLYRIRTPDGVALCNLMNASMQGSCANVQGTPYAVDASLLQYVLTQAERGR